MFIDRLVKQIKDKKSNVVVGLDPNLELMPEAFKNKFFSEIGKNLEGAGEIILSFNKIIIDHLWDIVPAVKPQIAFYEQYGLQGMKAYIDTCKYAREKGLLVIGDVKRGDIGTTSKAYSNAHLGAVNIGFKNFEAFPADAITTNPYLGDDCLKEFMDDIEYRDKGMFVLIKTSNPTSGQLQDLDVNGSKIYEIVARMVYQWSLKTIGNCGYSSVGGVVAATHPIQAIQLRKMMPKAYFLVPGYGAQGGSAKDIVSCFNEDGFGALINSSRDIIYAYKKEGGNYDENHIGQSARRVTQSMQKSINEAIDNRGK